MAWPKNHSTEIDALRARVAELETALEREKSARLEDKIEVLKKLASVGEDLGRAVSGLRPRRAPDAPVVYSNAADFRKAIEREEGVNVA